MKILILLTALCILLLAGYTGMGKDNVFDTHLILNKLKEIASPSPSAQKHTEEESVTNNTLKTSKDRVDTLLADAKTTLEEKPAVDRTEEEESIEGALQTDETGKSEGMLLQKGNIEPPVFETMKDNTMGAESKSRQWELLENANRVLADVGEMLK